MTIPLAVIGAVAGAPDVEPPSVPTYRFFRIYITNNNGDSYTALQELELSTSGGGSDFTSPGMTVSASSNFDAGSVGSRVIDNAFTNIIKGAWVSSGGSFPQWVAVDTAGSYGAVELRLFCQNYAGGPARAPKDFLVEGSNDGSSWTTIKTVTGETGWTAGVGKTFSLV